MGDIRRLYVEVRDEANYDHSHFMFPAGMPLPSVGAPLRIEGRAYTVISLVWEFSHDDDWQDDVHRSFDAVAVVIYVNRIKE